MFFAFCCYIFFVFAARTELLSTPSDVYIFCSHIMYGDLGEFRTIFNIDGLAAVVFLLPFTFITKIAFSSMFTAIILSAFTEASEKLHQYLNNRKHRYSNKHHWIFRMKYRL